LPVPVYVVGAIAAMAWMWNTHAATAVAPGVFAALWILTGVAATGLLVSAVSPRRSLIDLFYYLFLTFFVTGPAAVQVATGEFPWEVEHQPHHAATATWLLATAMLAYELGRRLQARLVAAPLRLAQPVAPSPPLTLALVVGVTAGVVVIPLAGLELLLADRGTLFASNIDAGIRGYSFLILKNMALATAIWAIAVAYSFDATRDGAATRRFLRLLALLAVAVTALVFNPLVNPRFVFAAAAIAILFMVSRPLFFHVKPLAVLVFPILLFYAFPDLKALSDAEARDEFLQELTRFDVDYLTSVDFDTFQCAANAVRYVEEVGLLGLQSVLGGLLFFVPRAIWPDKPLGSGLVVFDELGYWYVNVSMPLHMEFFLAAGVVGLTLGMLALGGVVGWLEAAGVRASRLSARTPADVLIALAGGFTVITLRGSLAAVAVFVGIPLGWALVALWLTRTRRPAAAEANGAATTAAAFGDWRDRFARAKRRDAGRSRVGRMVPPARVGRRVTAVRAGPRGG
jgi:hypothetical protein